MFTLTFLGTSSGVPTRQRNVTALALQTGLDRGWWLVDCGEATQHQLLHVPLTTHTLAGVCITHLHGDHCYGLPGLLAGASMSGRTKPLLLVAPAPVRAWVEATIAHTELFLTFPLIHVDVAATPTVFEESGLRIERFALSHRAPSFGYRFTAERMQRKLDVAALQELGVPAGPEWGRLHAGEDVALPDGRVVRSASVCHEQRERAAVVVGGDNDTPALLAGVCDGAQLLVHEGTYSEAMLQKVGPGPTHSSVQRVAQFAQAAQLPNLILTHFSARYHHGRGMDELEAEARAHYTGQVHMAEDFATYTLDPDGLVRRAPSRVKKTAADD